MWSAECAALASNLSCYIPVPVPVVSACAWLRSTCGLAGKFAYICTATVLQMWRTGGSLSNMSSFFPNGVVVRWHSSHTSQWLSLVLHLVQYRLFKVSPNMRIRASLHKLLIISTMTRRQYDMLLISFLVQARQIICQPDGTFSKTSIRDFEECLRPTEQSQSPSVLSDIITSFFFHAMRLFDGTPHPFPYPSTITTTASNRLPCTWESLKVFITVLNMQAIVWDESWCLLYFSVRDMAFSTVCFQYIQTSEMWNYVLLPASHAERPDDLHYTSDDQRCIYEMTRYYRPCIQECTELRQRMESLSSELLSLNCTQMIDNLTRLREDIDTLINKLKPN